MELGWSDEFLLLIIDLHRMPVGVVEAIRSPATEIAIRPADTKARGLEYSRPSLERLRRGRAPRHAPHARILGGLELQGGGRIVAIAAQVNRTAALVHRLHTQEVTEIPKALVGFRR